MKNRAENALIEMGMPANLYGFRYIVYAMELLQNEENRCEKMMLLYQSIAKRYSTTVSKVERAIRHAFGIVLDKGNPEAVEKYLTLHRTTNGNLLYTLYFRLEQEDGNED